MGWPCDTTEDLEQMHSRFANLSTFNEMGDLMKCSRWDSIHDTWRTWRPDAVGARVVLKDLAEEADTREEREVRSRIPVLLMPF